MISREEGNVFSCEKNKVVLVRWKNEMVKKKRHVYGVDAIVMHMEMMCACDWCPDQNFQFRFYLEPQNNLGQIPLTQSWNVMLYSQDRLSWLVYCILFRVTSGNVCKIVSYPLVWNIVTRDGLRWMVTTIYHNLLCNVTLYGSLARLNQIYT